MASFVKRAWRKKYSFVDVATSEAAELGMITQDMRRLLAESQRMPTYPQGSFAGEADVDLAELVARDFRAVGIKP